MYCIALTMYIFTEDASGPITFFKLCNGKNVPLPDFGPNSNMMHPTKTTSFSLRKALARDFDQT
jgi:hypothetical protein